MRVAREIRSISYGARDTSEINMYIISAFYFTFFFTRPLEQAVKHVWVCVCDGIGTQVLGRGTTSPTSSSNAKKMSQ